MGSPMDYGMGSPMDYGMGSPMDSSPPNSKNSSMYIIIGLVCVCIVCMIILPVGYYLYSVKKASATVKKKNITIPKITIPDIPGIPSSVDIKSLTLKKLSCTIKLIDNVPLYTCTHPDTSNIIKLINGPILKMSASNEIDSSKNETTSYYIIVPYIFVVDFLISLGLKEIEFKSLDHFIEEIDKLDKMYDDKNTIPDKCLKLPVKTRNESKKPYNTTCIFFPGFSSMSSLITTIQKGFVPLIPIDILIEYYNKIDKKLQDKKPELTIFEYVMYLASMNLVKSKKYRYSSICESVASIEC